MLVKREKISQFLGRRILTFLLLAVLISGCVTMKMYEGDKLTKDQIGIVKGSTKISPFGTMTVKILEVDAEPCQPIVCDKVEVLPGGHRVRIRVTWSPYKGFGFPHWEDYILDFNTEAGHEYQIKPPASMKKDSPATIVDTHSGQMVVSQCQWIPWRP